MVSKYTLAVVAVTGLIRILLVFLFPGLQRVADQSVEFSTPVTSYKSLLEGIFLLKRVGTVIDIYDGGVVHQTPLLIAFFQQIQPRYHYLIFILFDCLIAAQLLTLTRRVNHTFNFINVGVWLPSLIHAINPIAMVSCISNSSIIFTNWAILNALIHAVGGNVLGCAFFLALSGYLSLYPIMLFIPLLNLMYQTGSAKAKRFIPLFFEFFSALVLFCQLLLYISYKINDDSWSFMEATYGVRINFADVKPNLGLWWYFFIEMFDEFIPFFKAVFNLFVICFVFPITLRFHNQPLYAFLSCMGWICLTKPYPTLGDMVLWMSLLTLTQPFAEYMRYKMVSMLLYLHAVLLSPIFYHLWVDLGSGNSNFFYAISLLYCLAVGAILTDLIWSMLRYEYDSGRPDFSLKLVQL